MYDQRDSVSAFVYVEQLNFNMPMSAPPKNQTFNKTNLTAATAMLPFFLNLIAKIKQPYRFDLSLSLPQ